MSQPLIELAGDADAPPLHLAPANGFPPRTYLPLLQKLSAYRCLSLPPRALWDGEEPPSTYRDWRADADDLLAGLAAHQIHGAVAVGHSLGGIVSMLALLKEPERFKALIMLDPPILAPALLAEVRRAWDAGAINQMPLVQGALRRRETFASRKDAFARFRQKGLFADWSDDALWFYVEHGLSRRAAGDEFELVWSREWEAHYFSTVHLRIWEDLPRLTGSPPALIVRGRESDAFVAEAFARLLSLRPAAHCLELDGQGHLFPQAAPELTARVILDWLETVGL